jgi:hypothetical protein
VKIGRRGFLGLLGGAAAAVVAAPSVTQAAAPLFIPAERLDMGVPRTLKPAPVSVHPGSGLLRVQTGGGGTLTAYKQPLWPAAKPNYPPHNVENFVTGREEMRPPTTITLGPELTEADFLRAWKYLEEMDDPSLWMLEPPGVPFLAPYLPEPFEIKPNTIVPLYGRVVPVSTASRSPLNIARPPAST